MEDGLWLVYGSRDYDSFHTGVILPNYAWSLSILSHFTTYVPFEAVIKD